MTFINFPRAHQACEMSTLKRDAYLFAEADLALQWTIVRAVSFVLIS